MSSLNHRGGRPHALVVGATGMLRGLTLSLAGQGYVVSAIARNRKRLQAVADAAAGYPGSVDPLPVDYRHGEQLQAVIRSAMAVHGPIILAVCWIHSTAPAALAQIARVIETGATPCRLFHVRGSAAANPAQQAQRLPDWLDSCPHIRYRQVVLGFMMEGGRSRWLTHDEISGGVLRAVQDDVPYSVVGTVEPWSLRP